VSNPVPRGSKIGVLEIRSRGVRTPIRAGTTTSTLQQSAGWYRPSVRIGAIGNAVVAGHRTSGTAPFRHLDRTRVGDTVVVRTDRSVMTFRVTSVFAISKHDEHRILQPSARRTLTLYTCHPRGSTKKRLVVRAVFVGSAPAQRAAPASQPTRRFLR
jgi:sortase A